MDTNEFEKLWNNVSDALYEPDKTREILNAFNQAISGLLFIGSEEEYIFNVLNAGIPTRKEYNKLANSIGEDLSEICYKLEAMRSILFGDSIEWNFVCDGLDAMVKEKAKEKE